MCHLARPSSCHKASKHRGDCAKGARKVFSQAATGRHPLQSSCNPRRAKHIKPQRFDWCLQSNGRARAWIRPWSLPAWTVSRVGHKQFSTVPNKKLPSQGFVPPNGAAASMSCPPNDTWRDRPFLAGNTAPNPLGRLESPFHLRTWSPPRWPSPTESRKCLPSCRPLNASKQHRRSIRRFADHGSVQWPLLYGPETVRVPRGNAVQVIPAFFVGVSLPDIFFSRRSPLASAGGHGSNCDRTDVPYLEHDASYSTDPQCTTTGHWSASHASDDNASTMQEQNYLPRQRSANAQLQVIVSIYRYSTQRCLQPQVR